MADRYVDNQRDISLALIAAAARETEELDPYLVHHLPWHVAEGDAWRFLAAAPLLLDQLDPSSVAAEALRSVFMSDRVPPEIAGVIAAHHKLQPGRRSDRAGVRQLATSFVQGFLDDAEPPSERAPWTVAWAATAAERLHLTLPAHLGFVNEICTVADDGRALLASGGDDCLVRIWDPLTAAPRGEPLRAHRGTVEAVCEIRLPGGRAGVASAGSDALVCAWDVTAGRLHVPPMAGHVGTVRALCAIARPDGSSWIASAGYDGTIRLWDPAADGRSLAVLHGHQGPVVALAPSVTDRYRSVFYSASVDGSVRRWTAGETIGEVLVRRESGLRSLCVSRINADVELIAFAGYDGLIEVVRSDRPDEVVDRLHGHHGAVWGLNASSTRDGALVLSAGDDATVREWYPGQRRRPARPLVGHVGTVVSSCVVAAPGGSYLIASGGSDGTIRLWSPGGYGRTESRLRVADPLRDVCVATSSTGEDMLVTVSLSGEICFWNHRTGTLRRPPVQVDEVPIWCVCAVGPGDRAVAVGTNDGRVLLLDETGAVTGAVIAHHGPVRGLTVAATGPASRALASVGDDRRVRLWHLENFALAADPPLAHPGAGTISGVVAIGTGAASDWLATCADDGSIQMWDPVAASPVGEPMVGHVGPVLCLSGIRPTAERSGFVVSAGVDATVRVWRPGHATALLEVTSGHAGGIRDVAVVAETNDLAEVVTVGADGRVIVYRLHRTPTNGWLLADQSVVHEGTDGGLRAVIRVAWGRDDGFVVVGEAGAVLVWSVADRRPLREPLTASSAVQHHVLPVYADGGRYCAGVGGDGGLRLWDLRRAALMAEVDAAGNGAFTGLDVHPRTSGTVLVTGGSDGQIRSWDGSTLDPQVVLAAGGSIVDVCWIDRNTVAAALEGGAVELWDLPGGHRVARADAVGALSLSRAELGRRGPWVLFTAADGRTGLLQPHGGQIVWSNAIPRRERFNAAVWIPSAADRPARVASVGTGGSVELWEPTATSMRTLAGATGSLQAAAWLIIGETPVLAAGGSAGEIVLWDLDQERRLDLIPVGVKIYSLADASSADSARLLVGTARGAVCLQLDATITNR